MYKEFFLNHFIAIRGASSEERREELIKRMVTNFTMYVLSELSFDDYVIPHYVKRILEDYSTVYMDALNPDYDYLKVYFPDFDIIFEEKFPIEKKTRELGQKIKKYCKICHAVLSDEDIDDVAEVFRENNTIIDVVILNRGYNGGDIYLRDKNSPYLIHKFLSRDNAIYTAIEESNRSINEFLAKVECEYNDTFFL